MAKRNVFNRRMQHILRLSDEHTPIIKTIQRNSLAATRCRLDAPFDETTNPPPREDAYMIVIQIRGKNSRELWLDGKPIKTEPLGAGGVVFHDMRQSPRFYFHDPLDSVNYFLPRKILDTIADEADAPRISDLNFTPGVLTGEGHAMIAATLLPRIMAAINRRPNDALPSSKARQP